MALSAHPSWTPAQVRNDLVNRATTGKVTSPGTGSPNRLLFTGTGGAPPVINSLLCEYLGNNRFLCSMSATGWTQIRWFVNGGLISAWNDRTSNFGGCSSTTTVRVEVSNAHGTASSQRTFGCTGPPR
jgi:hypothetical protein